MSAPVPVAFPGSRSLQLWWRQLEPLHPQALWIAHLDVHHLEVPVYVRQNTRLGPVPLLLLEALAPEPQQSASMLAQRLHLDPALVPHLLAPLREAGLVQQIAAGTWMLSPLGELTQRQGEVPCRVLERRTFSFMETGEGPRHLEFLNCRASAGTPSSVEDLPFDVTCLEKCLQQPLDWKRLRGFPTDVEALGCTERGQDRPAGASLPAPSALEAWQRVPVLHPQRYLLALVLTETSSAPDRLLGFAIQQRGWTLHHAEPLFRMGEHWPSLFGELLQEPPLEGWREAWLTWARSVGLKGAPVEPALLERCGLRLRVHVATAALEHLQRVRSHALRGEAWVLAGQGCCRQAARLEIVPASPGAQVAPSAPH